MAKASWITLSVASGSGNKEVSVTAAANPGEPRETTLTVVAGNITKTVSCTQDDPTKLNISVAVDPTTIGAKCSIGSSATAGVSSGSFYPNTKITVTASSAPTGYDFLGWYSGSSRLSTSLSYTHILSSTVSLVAKYALKTYTINISSENTSYGTVSPATQTVNHGEFTQIKATRKLGYEFDGWYENDVRISVSATYSFNATSNMTLVAKWKVFNISVPIDINPSNSGIVNPNPATGQEATDVVLTITPSTGYNFKHLQYSGELITENPATIKLKYFQSGTAFFEKKTYTITLKANGGVFGTANGWTINSDKTTATKSITHGNTYGTLPTISRSASSTHTYSFNGYTPECSASTVATESATHAAQWTETKIEYLVTLDANGGKFTTAENYWSISSDKTKCTQYVDALTENYGQIPTPVKEDTAQYSYTFTGFDPPCDRETKASSNITHMAQYKATTRSYTVTLNAGGGTFAATSGWTLSANNTVATKTVVYGSTVGTLPSISRASSTQYSYSFKAYSPTVSSSTTVTGNITATAQWNSTVRSYTVTLNAGGGVFSATSGWSLSSSNTVATKSVAYGSTVGTLPTISRSSTAQYSYSFKAYSPAVTTTTTVTGAITATAEWTSTTRSYTLTVNAGTGGTVTGGGTYAYGTKVTIKATASTNYRFVKWDDGNTSASREVTVTGAATYTATFEFVPYLDLDVTELTFEAAGGTKYINISSNVSWTIS